MNLFTKKKRPRVWQQCPCTGRSQLSGTISQPFRQCTHDISPLGSSFWTKNKNPKTYCGLLKRSSEIVWEKFFEFLTYLCINFNSSSCRNKYKSKCKIQKINLIGGAEVLLYLYELGCFAYHSHPLYYVIALQLVYDFFSIIKLNTGWSFLYFPKARTQILILQPSHWR